MKCFFSITFDIVWMLAEMLISDLLMIYGGNIIELRIFGSFASKLFLFIVIIALKKVFTNEKIRELPQDTAYIFCWFNRTSIL